MRNFVFLILFGFQSLTLFSGENPEPAYFYKEILYSVNDTYKSKEALPDSIRKLIPEDLILFNDKKAVRKIKRKSDSYKQIFLVAAFHDFFLVNFRHYEAGSHDHVLIFSYQGKLLLDQISGYNIDETFELLQRQLVKKKQFEDPDCGAESIKQ